MAKQYASQTSQNTASTQTYSPSDIAKALLSKASAPITSEQLQQYQSPYQQQVIDATMAQLNQQYGQQQNALTGNAIAQGALGGDRAKVAQAALMGEQSRNTASTLAGLQQKGYETALSAAQSDLNRQIQAAGMSGGTTTGGSQMTGNTVGTEASQQSGTSQSHQTGTSHTTGYSTSETESDPTLFGLNLGGHADGGAIRHRSDGGGIPDWARPPTMQAANPMPMITAPSGDNKSMSTRDMMKLGDKARGQLDKMFSGEKGNSWGASFEPSSSNPSYLNNLQSTWANTQSSLGNMFGGSGAGDVGAGAGNVAGSVAAPEAATAAPEVAAGAADAAGAATTAGAGAADAAATGAGAAEAAGALGKGASAAGGAAAGAGEGASSLMGLLALLANGGAVRHRASGGGAGGMPGISMQKGIGQEWFEVPTLDPTSGIKGSGMADGGTVRHRDAGGVVSQSPAPATNQAPVVAQPAAAPAFGGTPNGKGSRGSRLDPMFSRDNLSNQSFDRLFSQGKGSSPAQGGGATPVTNQQTPSSTSNGKGSGQAQYAMMADGGTVRHRADGGEDYFDPAFMDTGGVGAGGAGGLASMSGLTAEDTSVDKPLQRSAAELEARKAALEELRSQSRRGAEEEPARPTFPQMDLASAAKDWWNKPSGPDTAVRLGDFTDTAKANPSIGDLAQKAVDPDVEPVPVYMKTAKAIDPITGKDMAEPQGGLAPLAAKEAAPGAEPGAEEVAPEKPVNHASTIVEGLRGAGASDNAIRGVLANVQDESGFEPGLRHPDQPKFTGEAHYAHGLFQIGGEEWNKYSAWLQKDHPDADWRDPKLQTQFMAENLKTNYPQVWKKMNEGTPEEAAQVYVSGYLRPAKQYEEARLSKYGKGVLGINDYTNDPNMGTSVESGPAPTAGAKGSPGRTGSLAGLNPAAGAPAANAATAPAVQPWSAPQAQGAQEGNILTRILGAGLNPLKMSDKDLSFIAQAALGGMGGINKAAETAQGTRAQDIQAQQHAVQMAMEAQKLQHLLAQPVVTGEYMDQNTGTWHKQYSSLNPQTNKYEVNPISAPGFVGSSGPVSIDAIAPNTSGNDFITEAKKAGYSPAVLSSAQRVADYRVDPAKLTSVKGEQRAIIDRLASRINPDYDASRYAAVADSEKKLASGDVAKALRTTGRLFDEVDQAIELVDKVHNTGSEYANRAAHAVYPSGSQYGTAMGSLGTALNNVVDTASAVAKGGGQGAEGDAKRRRESMNEYQAPANTKGSLKTEAEIGLKNGQSNLTSYNVAHGYTPDNPKYKTIMDFMTPAQQQKAVKMLGPDKIEEITGKPAPGSATANERPLGVSRVQQATRGPAPSVGTVMKGYRFKGGDPAQQANWELAK